MIRIAFIITLSGLIFHSNLVSQEQTQTTATEENVEPRIAEILARIEAAKESRLKGIDERTAKYIEHLTDLEKKIQITGDLDKVLEVTKEREAWQAGKKTPAMNPRDNSIGLELRKARYYFDRDLNQINANSEKVSYKLYNGIIADLNVLLKTFTTEGKISDALQVRKIKEEMPNAGIVSFKKKSNPELAATTAPAKPNIQRETIKPEEWGRDMWINKSSS